MKEATIYYDTMGYGPNQLMITAREIGTSRFMGAFLFEAKSKSEFSVSALYADEAINE